MTTSSSGAHAARALEYLIGEDNIRDAVQAVLDLRGEELAASEIALGVLRHIGSLEATEEAYRIFEDTQSDDAARAVLLMSHPRALDWVDEFLEHPTAALAGIGVVDQLVWRGSVDSDDERVQSALALALKHKNAHVRRMARDIRASIRRTEGRRRKGAEQRGD